MEDLISVIVPVYKVEKYIHKCIDSIINQTYTNLEIILVDDGSPDSCGKICDEYAKKDNRIKVIHKTNGGLSDARNAGTKHAKGTYLTYIDSDDFVSENYIEYMYNLLKHSADITFATCGVEIIRNKSIIQHESDTNFHKYNREEAFTSLLYDEGLFLSAWGKLFRTDFIKNYSFPKGKAYEDTAVIYKWINDSNKIICGEEKCYYYVDRANSISNQKEFNNNEIDYINNSKLMLKFINENYGLDEAVERFFLYVNFRELRILLLSKNKNKQYEEEMWSNIKKHRITVLKNKKISKRDKLAIYTSFFGKKFFKLAWIIYCKLTKRII